MYFCSLIVIPLLVERVNISQIVYFTICGRRQTARLTTGENAEQNVEGIVQGAKRELRSAWGLQRERRYTDEIFYF